MSNVMEHALSTTRTAVLRGTHGAATQQLQKLHTMDARRTFAREIALLQVVLACRTFDDDLLIQTAAQLQPASQDEIASAMDMLSRTPETQRPSYAAFARRAVTLLGFVAELPERGKIAARIGLWAGALAWVGWTLYFFMFFVRASAQGEMSPEEGAQFGAHPILTGIQCSILATSVPGVIAGIVAVRITRAHKTSAYLGLIASSLALLLMIVLIVAGIALLI
ncbi:MAG: hypothetical protein EXS15_07875 [Phycisphaerales bacterium]|nr:hypothetical protein [Phycisphaerales bacterium]